MHKSKSSIIWGLILLIAGIIFLGNTFMWWNIDIFFKGWWTLFIIIPSVIGLIKKEWISSLLGLSIGILLLLASMSYIEWKLVGEAFIPIMLIIIGCSLLFKPKVQKIYKNDKGLSEYVAVFSTNNHKVDEKFEGCSIVSVFGSVDLNLRDSKIKEDIILECVSVFGSINIKVPNNVKVKHNGVPIFGGLDDSSIHREGPTVNINYVSIFGGIEVK